MKIAILIAALLLQSCAPWAYEDSVYHCGDLIPIRSSRLHGDLHCQYANGFGCTSREICKGGKWIGVETGPWWRCDCGNDLGLPLPIIPTTTEFEIDNTKVCDLYDSKRCWSK